MEFKGTEYYKNNCEENYINTPISVLAYISQLENEREEILEFIKENYRYLNIDDQKKAEELIKKATTI